MNKRKDIIIKEDKEKKEMQKKLEKRLRKNWCIEDGGSDAKSKIIIGESISIPAY